MLTLVVALAVAAGALAQAVSGIGFVLVCGPLLVAALGQHEAVRLAVVLSLVVNVVLLLRGRARVEWRPLLWLLVPAALATPLLAAVASGWTGPSARVIAAAATLAGVAALAAGLRWRRARGRAGALVAGVVSAAMNVVAGIGGPAVALYAANADWSPERLRGTVQLYFLVLNLVALASLGPPALGPVVVGSAGVALAAGLAVGLPLAHRVRPAAARRVLLALAALGAGLVLLNG